MKERQSLILLLMLTLIQIMAGCGSSNNTDTPTSTPGSKPASPTNLTVLNVAIGANYLGCELQWNDNSDNEDKFILQRKVDVNGTYIDIPIPFVYKSYIGTETYTDDQLSDQTVYYYRIKARNTYGDSEYSNEVSIKTTGDINIIIQ